MGIETIVVKFKVDVRDNRHGYASEFLAHLDSYLGGVPQVSEWDNLEEREDFLVVGMELQ